MRAALAVVLGLVLFIPTTATAAAPAEVPRPAADSRDLDGDGNADVVAIAQNGSLWLYPGNGAGGWGRARQIGVGWRTLDEVRIAGDLDGDGNADVVARDLSGGLWLYSGNGTGGFSGWRRIGVGWSAFSDVLAPGDWDGDGDADLIGILRDDTSMWLYPGTGSGGFDRPRKIGAGWASRDLVTPVGDWDGDGANDLVARSVTDGTLWLYSGNGTGGFRSWRVIGAGWTRFTALLGPGDFSGDGAPDLLGRLPGGDLWLYPGSGTGAFTAPFTKVGVGWDPLLLNEPTQVPRRVITYTVSTLGAVGGDLGQFARHVAWTLADPRGWSMGGAIRFDRVASGGMMHVYLASPAAVNAAGSVCSSAYSCRVGTGVFINDVRWRYATPTFASFSRSDYQHYVVIHEVGHYLGLGHAGCPAVGTPAPVMMQQSISLGGCRQNLWPLGSELRAVAARWL
ncbi:MAG: VCBS repeat-containing protein [Actinomycetales bacterium]|nr:VCBS repeat-containing protein [Actinomycetales bacterium]